MAHSPSKPVEVAEARSMSFLLMGSNFGSSPDSPDFTVSGLAAGEYTIYLRDTSNFATGQSEFCLKTIDITIPEGRTISLETSTKTDISCYDGSDGMIQPELVLAQQNPGEEIDWSAVEMTWKNSIPAKQAI